MSFTKRLSIIALLLAGFFGAQPFVADVIGTHAAIESVADAAYYTTPSTTVGASFGRSTTLLVPNDWRPDRSYVLLVVLHPYASTGSSILTNLGLNRANNFDDGTIVFAPNGVTDGTSLRWKYWDQTGTDDFVFLHDTIQEIQGRFSISRVYMVGYSNGGFMTLQFAQFYPTMLSSIAVFAAADGTNDPTSALATPLPMLHVYGASDATVEPAGNASASSLPGTLNGHGGIMGGGSTGFVSAATTVANWAARNGLGGSMGSAGTAFDLITGGTPSGAGAESTPSQWSGAISTNMVEQWVEAAAGHSAVATLSNFRGSYPLYIWLEQHHR